MTKMEILAALVISASIGVAVGLEVHKILVAVAVGCALAVSSVLFMSRRTPDSKLNTPAQRTPEKADPEDGPSKAA